MTIYPAIDIKSGRAVRLLQGRADQETVYASNPSEVAKVFKETGSEWVHVVDLDGAFGGAPKNLAEVQAIVATGLKVQLGGGMRDRETVVRALEMGVSRVVVGTRAAESEEFIRELVQEFGDKIAVGIDAKDGKVAVKGWVSTTDTTAIGLARSMDAIGVSTLIYTDIGTDGMLTGPNLAAQEEMASTVRASVIASGGVSRREDVLALAEIEKRRPNLDGVIVGKALYEKRVELSDLLAMGSR
jgi:phosphoribosylformimino-5-aminoimidazole carboxamide ribotide isomerase